MLFLAYSPMNPQSSRYSFWVFHFTIIGFLYSATILKYKMSRKGSENFWDIYAPMWSNYIVAAFVFTEHY